MEKLKKGSLETARKLALVRMLAVELSASADAAGKPMTKSDADFIAKAVIGVGQGAKLNPEVIETLCEMRRIRDQ